MTKRAAQIPKGATGIYKLDCPTSPPRFEAGEVLTVVKKGPPGHCIVSSSAGIEAIIRNTEIVLDEKWVMYQAQLPGESGVNWSASQNEICSRAGRSEKRQGVTP
jgi:hypothetical protein